MAPIFVMGSLRNSSKLKCWKLDVDVGWTIPLKLTRYSARITMENSHHEAVRNLVEKA